MGFVDPDDWELLKLSLVNPITIIGLLIVIPCEVFAFKMGLSNDLIFLYSIGFSIFIFGVSLGYAKKSMVDQKAFKAEILSYFKKYDTSTQTNSRNFNQNNQPISVISKILRFLCLFDNSAQDDSRNFDRYQSENNQNENNRLILQLYHTRNNQLATYIQLTTAGIWGFLGLLFFESFTTDASIVTPNIFAAIAIVAMVVWRVYSLILDRDILKCYEKILICECKLNIDFQISLLKSLTKKISNFPTNLNKIDTYKYMLNLIKEKKILRPDHRFLDFIAGVVFIIMLVKIFFL